MMTRRRVLTIGGAMIDTIAVIDDELIERMIMNNAEQSFLLLEEGRKTEAALVSTHAGGGAINSAVSFARLGFTVATLVKVGRDARAETIRAALEAEGVSRGLIVETDRAASGASVLVSAHERNAAIFTFRGANSLLESSDLPNGAFAEDIVYIAGLSEGSADAFPEIVARAALNKAFIAANPGIRQLSARGDAFQKALSNLSLLSMNRREAETLVPRLMKKHPRPRLHLAPAGAAESTDLMRRGFAASGFEMTLAHFLEALLRLGPQCVLITDGKRGAYAAVEGEVVFCPSLPADVVGTAGAGDAFTSTFTAMYASGSPPGDALQYAATNAGSVVRFADTQSGLLRREVLEATRTANIKKLTLQSWRLD